MPGSPRRVADRALRVHTLGYSDQGSSGRKNAVMPKVAAYSSTRRSISVLLIGSQSIAKHDAAGFPERRHFA